MSLQPDDELLRRIVLFRRLSPGMRARVAEVAHLRSYERGDTIFSEGDAGDVFIAIVTGRVKVFKSTPAGKEIILEIFGAGDPLGAVAVYDNLPFPASAVTLEPTQCLRIEQAAFFRLLEQDPALVRGLLSGLTLRLAELTRRLAELSGARVETRFARLFLKALRREGHSSGKGIHRREENPAHGGQHLGRPRPVDSMVVSLGGRVGHIGMAHEHARISRGRSVVRHLCRPGLRLHRALRKDSPGQRASSAQ